MASEFSPYVGSPVSKEEAQAWIDRYEKEVRLNPTDTKSVFYGSVKLQEVVATPGASGISFFFAKKFDNEQQKDIITLVLVPTSEEGKLLWVGADQAADGGSNTMDYGSVCPPRCPQ